MVIIHSYRANDPILTHPTNPAHTQTPSVSTPLLFHLSVSPPLPRHDSNSNSNPFPWGIGWRAFFLGCSLGDRKKFEHTMEVCSKFSNIDDMHKEADAVMKKATPDELKTLISDPARGDVSGHILAGP